jgi:tetratricopeptide (TPR) repeat protein
MDWSAKNARVALPLLSIGMPDAPKKTDQPVELGSPLEVVTHLTLSLPAGFAAVAPVGIAVNRDYAEFKSSYQWKDGALTANRSLDFKMRDLSASRRGDYLAFTHAIDADQAQPLSVKNESPGAPVVPSGASANELFEAGTAQLAAGNAQSAIPLFGRVVVIEPEHPEAWNSLGLAHLRLAHFDQAVAAFEKQLQINPSDAHSHNYLGLTFEQQQKYDEAAGAFRKQIDTDPLDTIAHAALGTILLAQHRYSEAVPELDKATVLSPRKAELQIGLGEAYLNLGQNDKAVEAFERAVAISPTPAIWNNAAYNLADHKVNLAVAQKYAESALSAAAADLAKIDLQHLSAEQIRGVASIGNYWDTLGWIYFQKGDLDSADRYIRAAWLLDQHGEVADHLAQIYEKRGNKEEAVRTCAIALAASHPSPDTRARLTLLRGGNAQIDDIVSQARPKLVRLRTFPAGKLPNDNWQANFAVLLSPGKGDSHTPRVAAVNFLGGNEKLRAFADRLRSLDYGPMFPDASPVNLVRRGTLSCSAASSDCSFTLLTAEEIPTDAGTN